MKILTDPRELQVEALRRRASGARIGFVPTMGFLHPGHTSLFDLARQQCDWLVASIYVNPLQFGPNEDLAAYPRNPDGDAALCEQHGVDCLFMPVELYASGHSTTVRVEQLSQGLCGTSRPTHFEGVTTVVARLFGLVQPNLAVFGEKDYQQLAVIRRMVQDLAMPIDIVGGPLIRDTDGLALSSRNAYLSPQERLRARTIYQALSLMQDMVQSGETHCATLLKAAEATLNVDRLDYLEIRDGRDLSPVDTVHPGTRAFAAAWVGKPRLIDNLELMA